ncbi:SipW-dependent-type signal peptide-containing protein [Candidatus Pacebacteria bacterium]|nr:SipW-dependent-type signal peptide-containing protein [Candidatus Paceibacterota bacterium]
MKKILLGIAALGLVGAVAGSATVAFYNDVERSTGNTFTAGGVELRVDSVSHYNSMICVDVGDTSPLYEWQPESGFSPLPGHFPEAGTECDGTWAETDLVEGVHTFFNFLDLKPGDEGEDTISLHVYDNPAWGQFLVEPVIDRDNTCTDPEQEAEGDGICQDPDGDGEIDNYLRFDGWVDQGAISGFQCGAQGPDNAQCTEDPTEGDNIYQDTEGPKFWDNELIGDLGPFDLAPVFATAYSLENCSSLGEIDGDTNYGECHGYAEDGRMVASVTYYFGLAWGLDLQETGNDAQTDTYSADLTFRVEQHRNNPNPFQPI